MRHKNIYPKDQLDWLKTHRGKCRYDELAPAFNKKFGTNYSTPKIYGICDANGITTDKPRQTPARIMPNDWITWLQKEAPNYNNYVAFSKAFNAHFGTDYKSRSAFQRLCARAGVTLNKQESFPDFAEAHFDEVKAFCQSNWMSLTRNDFKDAFNAHFHTNYSFAIGAWVSANASRLGLPSKRMPQYEFTPSAEELYLFKTRWKSMTANDFAVLCNEMIDTNYDAKQASHRAAWLVKNGYLKDSDVRKKWFK